jgi:DNA-binding ferritin-like protein
MTKEEYVRLVEFVGRIGEVKENCGMTPTFIMHNNISNVETMHMQATTTHFCVVGTHFFTTTNFCEVEVMQLVVI